MRFLWPSSCFSMKNSTKVLKWVAVQKHYNFLNFSKVIRAQSFTRSLIGWKRSMMLTYTRPSSPKNESTWERLTSKFQVPRMTSTFWGLFLNTYAKVNSCKYNNSCKIMVNQRSIFGWLVHNLISITWTIFSELMLTHSSHQILNAHKTLTKLTTEPPTLTPSALMQVAIGQICFSWRQVSSI